MLLLCAYQNGIGHSINLSEFVVGIFKIFQLLLSPSRNDCYFLQQLLWFFIIFIIIIVIIIITIIIIIVMIFIYYIIINFSKINDN